MMREKAAKLARQAKEAGMFRTWQLAAAGIGLAHLLTPEERRVGMWSKIAVGLAMASVFYVALRVAVLSAGRRTHELEGEDLAQRERWLGIALAIVIAGAAAGTFA